MRSRLGFQPTLFLLNLLIIIFTKPSYSSVLVLFLFSTKQLFLNSRTGYMIKSIIKHRLDKVNAIFNNEHSLIVVSMEQMTIEKIHDSFSLFIKLNILFLSFIIVNTFSISKLTIISVDKLRVFENKTINSKSLIIKRIIKRLIKYHFLKI